VKPLFALLLLAFAPLPCSGATETFYLGTYTKPGGSEGIYRYELDSETGAVKAHGLAATSSSPSFLALHANKKFLYAVNEAPGGGASAFAIEADGSLREISRESTMGNGPTHLCLDREAKHLLVANYGGGSVAALPIQPDGRLGKATGFLQHTGSGPNQRRQKGPHAHSIYVDESNRRALAADLGVDKVFLHKFDPAKGTLEAGEPAHASVPPGSGPRHLALGAKGLVYVVNEMANTVSVLAPEGAGLKEVQNVTTLPADFQGQSSTAEIFLHPSGRTLYVSNRGHDSIAMFRVEANGQLAPQGHVSTGGKSPRFFGLNPSGRFLLAANQATGNVVVFKVDAQTGALTPAGVEFKQAEPVCIVFVD
jgi:6-phosphogluconolactonase